MRGNETNRRSVIFDMDGVLVDSWPIAEAAFRPNDALPPTEVCISHLGRPLADILSEAGLPPSAGQDFRAYSRENAHRITVFKGIQKLLAALETVGFSMAVLTGKP